MCLSGKRWKSCANHFTINLNLIKFWAVTYLQTNLCSTALSSSTGVNDKMSLVGGFHNRCSWAHQSSQWCLWENTVKKGQNRTHSHMLIPVGSSGRCSHSLPASLPTGWGENKKSEVQELVDWDKRQSNRKSRRHENKQTNQSKGQNNPPFSESGIVFINFAEVNTIIF